MPVPDYALLLDTPAFPAERYAILSDRLAALMGTRNDVLLIQAEAVLALEAAATSLARPGLRALNIVTSPYGAWFGGWLARGGATVRNLTASPAKPVTLEEVERALNEGPGFDLLAIVHAESASGILNPCPPLPRSLGKGVSSRSLMPSPPSAAMPSRSTGWASISP